MDAWVGDAMREPHLSRLALAGTNAAEELENELAAATAVADALEVTDTDAKEESARADKEGGDQGDPKSVESGKVAPAPQTPNSPPDHGNGTAADPSVEAVAPDKVLASTTTKAVQAVNASSPLQPSPGEPDTPDASESIGQPDSNRTINPSELEGDPGRATSPATTKAPPPQPSPDSKKVSAEVSTSLPRAPPKRKGGQTVYDVMVQVRLGREEEVPSARLCMQQVTCTEHSLPCASAGDQGSQTPDSEPGADRRDASAKPEIGCPVAPRGGHGADEKDGWMGPYASSSGCSVENCHV